MGRHNKPRRPERSREPRSSFGSIQPEALAALQAAWRLRACLPRASASGLGPGLKSPGPLGRFWSSATGACGLPDLRQRLGGTEATWQALLPGLASSAKTATLYG